MGFLSPKAFLSLKQVFLRYYDQHILIKKPHEIASIRKACRITSDVYEKILAKDLKPGVREEDLAKKILDYAHEMGADETLAFPTMVGSGKNSSMVHSSPGRRRIKEGEVVQFDLGVRVMGYCSDLSRVVFMGRQKEAPGKIVRMMKLVKRLQKAGVQGLSKGMSLQQVADHVWEGFHKKGLHFHYLHSLGHGVGIEIHEFPRLSHEMDKELRPKPGMVMTVEPGLYFPGQFGCRIEDTVLITSSGAEVLTPATKRLWID